MNWTIVNFGKYRDKNKTLPQIIFDDADWFFWACEEGALLNNGIPKSEVNLIYKRARTIKPKEGYYVNHFLYDDGTAWGFSFVSIKEAEEYHKDIIGGGTFDKDYKNWDSTYRTILKYIDLSFPRQQKEYSKGDSKQFIKDLKDYLGIKRLSKKIVEDFFSKEENFI